jgi:PD-(D/E)XK nuclease superfamily
MASLERELSSLFVANDDFDQLERALDVFCPFEAVGMVRQEVRHGDFLSYIFSPHRPHGFGSACIRALMAAAARSDDTSVSGLGLLDIHLMDFDGAIIRREWRNIDILIEVLDQNLIVAIELKIDASEHSGQLARYRAQVEVEWPDRRHLFIFLTKRGDEPSDQDGDGWLSVDLEALASELRAVAVKEIGATESRQMLTAYLAMLGRHHLNNEELEQLAARLWTKHPAALSFLAERRPNAIGSVFSKLVDRRDALAAEIAANCGQKIVIDHWRPAAILFAVPDWDAVQGFVSAEGYTASKRLILLELVKSGPDYLRCYFQLGRGDQLMREKLFLRLREAGADVGKKLQPTKEWNRLASIMIPLKDLEDGADLDAVADRVFYRVRDFAAAQVPIYTKALLTLLD